MTNGKFIKAKFQSQCDETGNRINKGDSIYYVFSNKSVYCSTSDTYKKANEDKSLSDMINAQEEAYFDNFCQRNNI